MDLRKNHRDLSAAERAKFVSAVLALKNEVDSVLHPGSQSRYDDFVEVHKNAMTGPAMFHPMPHGTSLFFPWHRVMLREFELALRDAVSDGSISIPYWDWDMSGASNPFTPSFMGGDGDSAQQGRVTDGAFAFSRGQFEVRVWDGAQGDPALRRELGDDPTAWLPSWADVTAGLARTPFWPGAGSWSRVCEGVLHNPVHVWVGGNMEEASSPNDPVFYLHHAYLDLLWERWQVQHPTSDPYRPTSGSPLFDLDATLVFHASGHPAPWARSWRVRDTVKTADLGYAYA